ncbi:MAG: ABC transporter ATP-binding protein, partial [Victivallales bacterium]|nr:ABC transporter ATP-binding protein [Victivallales bacterium]
ADEPTTALDVTIQAQILELMRQVKGPESGLLLITHDMGVIWEMCDRVSVMYASRIVESGRVAELFAHPRHPYARGLLQSIPSLNPDVERLPHIPGQVPSLMRLPPGCAFADRCPQVQEKCRRSRPAMRQAGGHSVACFAC